MVVYTEKGDCMEIKKEDLVALKQDVLKQSDNGKMNRIILSGDKPILLTTTIFTDSDGEDYSSSFYRFFQNNAYSTSLLDCAIYALYKELGVYGLIDYIPMDMVKKDIITYKQIIRYYYDKDFRKLLERGSIDALYSINNGRFIANAKSDNLGVHELDNSFSFCGLTGTSKGLTDILDREEIKYHSMYGGGLDPDELKKLKLYFTDDTIKFNQMLKIGKVRNKPLERKNMWPRTLDISLNDNIELNEFYRVFVEYLEWALRELETKGTYDAMSPMRKLK